MGRTGLRSSVVVLAAQVPVMAWPAAAQTAASAAPAARPATLQQSFDAASAAAAAGKCTVALPLFERLAADPRLKKGSLAAAATALRRGVCLANAGRYDEAETQIAIGLPAVRQAGADFAGDVVDGEAAVAEIASSRFDHDGAVAHYTAAIAAAPEPMRISLYLRLAQVTQFDGGTTALDHVAAAAALVGKTPKPSRATLATIHTLRGRIFMAQGRNKEALTELRRALQLSGGLTTRISLSEAAMRGDLAQAALLTGDRDQARLYLSYTGAGRIQESPFVSARSMAPPACGPETGLSKDDVAIVEFGIADSGDVATARTVYTRGTYAVAAAFAKAVGQWHWQPDDLVKIPLFYKVLTRVELRCSGTGGDLPGVTTPLRQRFVEWAAPRLAGVDLDGGALGASMDRLAGIAKDREAAGDRPGTAAALAMRGILNWAYDPAAFADLDRAATLAGPAGVPTEAANAILVFRAIANVSQDTLRRRRLDVNGFDQAAATLAGNPALAADALARDTLLLAVTPSAPSAGRRATVTAALTQVADDARLPTHDPLRQVALLRLANIAAGDGDLAAAQGYFARTGLTEEQCSLIGAAPAMKATGSSSDDFPLEAARYGFEGWVNLEFDINANGTTARPRPVIAYPPFVFVDAATGMAKGFRYQASYRPSGSLACNAQRQTVRFSLPDH